MSSEKKDIPREEMADRFIALANEYAKTETKERIGAALMFAAARYNAYEASGKSKNLLADRQDAMNWYSGEYRRMFETNFDELIELKS